MGVCVCGREKGREERREGRGWREREREREREGASPGSPGRAVAPHSSRLLSTRCALTYLWYRVYFIEFIIESGHLALVNVGMGRLWATLKLVVEEERARSALTLTAPGTAFDFNTAAPGTATSSSLMARDTSDCYTGRVRVGKGLLKCCTVITTVTVTHCGDIHWSNESDHVLHLEPTLLEPTLCPCLHTPNALWGA